MTITVFTPTYNRAYILPQLYESLQQQTCKDFEWLIVDDGSSDNTAGIVQQWILEADFIIRYVQQENGGKHRAINRGAKEANGELFFIVDSDDKLTPNAIERILADYESIATNEAFAGVCGLRAFPDGSRIGGECDFGILDTNPLDLRIKHKIKGDMAEVVRTSVMRQFPFPDIQGERFCAESLIWDRISEKYIFRYFYEKIYICEYLTDGLTASMTRIRKNSPQYAKLYYSERFKRKLPIYEKIKAAINYWRFAFCDKDCSRFNITAIGIGVMLLPFGFLYYLLDKRVK